MLTFAKKVIDSVKDFFINNKRSKSYLAYKYPMLERKGGMKLTIVEDKTLVPVVRTDEHIKMKPQYDTDGELRNVQFLEDIALAVGYIRETK